MFRCYKMDQDSSVDSGEGDRSPPSCPSGSSDTLECAICLQSCVHPVRLPCCHVFCFLCVKGASWQSKRCALCRQEIPGDFLDHPVLLSPEELKAAAAGGGRCAPTGAGLHQSYAWYYEGRNGWWQYDERTSQELEEAFARGNKSTEMLIAGFLYVADLDNMVQYRRNEQGRRRKIKRDVVHIPKKGVAGLRLDPEPAALTDCVRSADGSDTAGQSQSTTFGFLMSLPPVRPPTLLGSHLPSPPSPSPAALEDSLSQLLLSQQEEVEGDDEPQTMESSSSGSEEDSQEWDAGRGRALTETQTARMPLRGGSSSALSLRSRSPDGQCTVTYV